MVRQIHYFFAKLSFYPLALSSVFAFALWVGRVYISDSPVYAFMSWNLFLAWIPYFISIIIAYLARHSRHGWMLAVPFAFWLIFFPNAPYIITDLLHLKERVGVPLWYDIGMLAAFAWTGLFLGIVSLNIMQTTIKRYWGNIASWLFVIGTVVLSGLGIYLGRFLEWNSWDLFYQPQKVLADLAVRLAHPLHDLQIYGVTMMFATFLFICYLTFVSVPQRERI